MCRDLRLGRSEEALESLKSRNRLSVAETQAEAVGRLLDDYRARRDQGLAPRDLVVVTDTSNQQIDQPNRLIQDDRRQRGELYRQPLVVNDTVSEEGRAVIMCVLS